MMEEGTSTQKKRRRVLNVFALAWLIVGLIVVALICVWGAMTSEG